ncbi:MAG TPA: hypothetical protein VMV10_20425 [Pirellulales bacterium]|nr:hypothetical protein [Pirellulales bacterium]
MAMLLDLLRLEQEQHPSYLAYFGAAIPDEELRYRPISGADRRYFAHAASNSRMPPIEAACDENGDLANQQLRRASA